jgi:integrase
MSPEHSTRKARTHPFTLHASGQYCKRVRGKLHYFGKNLDAALARWEAEKDDLLAGRLPRAVVEAVTIGFVCNTFLADRERKMKNGELSPHTWADYLRTCKAVVAAFGKGRLASDLRPADFAQLREQLARKLGLAKLKNVITAVRSIFNHAHKAELLDRPTNFGIGFDKPSMKALRIERQTKGEKLFTAEEIRRVLDAANVPMRAMILLGINCGFGPQDCASLPLAALDLEAAWHRHGRPKTGLPRRCPLWPETVFALRRWLARRPEPRQAADESLVFLTRFGRRFSSFEGGGAAGTEMGKLLRRLGLHKPGFGFYVLRHVHRTVADEVKDGPACDLIMGHANSHISSAYRERIGDDRLRAISLHVHNWLFS